MAIFFEASIFSVVALLIGKLGAITVAGHQIALNFSAITFMVPMSLAMGITIRVGQALGADRKEDAAYASYAGVVTTLMWATISASVMLFVPHLVAGIYTQDAAVAVSELLFFAAIFQYSDGLQISQMAHCVAIKMAKVPMGLILFAWVVRCRGIPSA